jgi:hypothetical protein
VDFETGNGDRSIYDKCPGHPPVSKVNDSINLSRFSRKSPWDETNETKRQLLEIWLKPCADNVLIVNQPINNQSSGTEL